MSTTATKNCIQYNVDKSHLTDTYSFNQVSIGSDNQSTVSDWCINSLQVSVQKAAKDEKIFTFLSVCVPFLS